MGRTVEISLQPTLASDLDATERSAPIQIDMRNVRITDVGNVKKRKGYLEKWDVGTEHPIDALIPSGKGYAIDGNGNIYIIGTSPASIGSLSPLEFMPHWVEYDGVIYVAHGSTALKIDNADIDYVTSMPIGRFITLIGTYTVIASLNSTRIDYSAPGTPEGWEIVNGAGFFNVQKTGTVQNMIGHKNNLFIFKEKEIDVYSFTQTSPPFRLQAGLNVDKGLGAVDSVVKANDRFYWYGDDGDFYEYRGGLPIVISDTIRARIDAMSNMDKLRGFDIRKENVIMWINPEDGITFIYDYGKGRWLEDNEWNKGWQSLPFKSYMEYNGEQYFGSRACDGKIHRWSDDYKDDNGRDIRVYRRLKAQLSQRGHNVRVDKIRMRRKGAVATASITSPTISVRHRFDKGNWSVETEVSTGAVGVHDPYIDIRRLGYGKELELEIVESDATDYLLTDLLVTYQEFKQ